MNRTLLMGTVALGIAATWLLWPSHAAAAAPVSPNELFAARRGDLNIVLTENGTMVAKESQKVSTKVNGESKVTFLIEEGKEVKEGEVVCRLDATQLQSQLEQVNLDILQTEASLKSAKTELEIQEVENEANLKKAANDLDKAKKEKEKFVDGEAPQQRRKLEVDLKDAETAFVRAKKKLDDSKKLEAQNYVKKTEVEDDQIAFERTEVQRESAKVALDMFDKYTYPMSMTDFETKVADADRGLTTAQKRGDTTLDGKRVAVQQVEKRLKAQNEQKKQREEDLANMEMKAPCPGIVVYGDPHEPWYRDRIKVGGSVWSGFTVLTIPDLRVMQVKLHVHEADISKLKVDLAATVTTDSYPGLRLLGKVSKIATVASSDGDWGSSEVKKFDVEVTLEPRDVQLRPGISAKCEIHVETLANVVHVPLQSVFAEDGVHYCHVATPGKGPQKRKVEVGKSNDVYIEVTAGLAEGEQVLLYNPMLPGSQEAEPAKDTPEAARPAPATTAEATAPQAKSGE
ncbi:MAG: HlyD family efflux transporter periplasmic adaptor subunit [Planctomycetes bacterium]|nr:HlyD family efflux transporter periplasmic adaptor subunit [Planctomycetota bacterium]